MTKRKSKKQQQAIATEVTEQQERRTLLRQIALMKRLPNDFRDIDPGSPDWENFADITDRRKEMTAWSNGPVIYFAELNEGEKMILGRPNKLIHYDGRFGNESDGRQNWQPIINTANFVDKASWLYLPDEEGPVIEALNVLFSRFGYSIRARGPVLSERTGKLIGVVT